MSETVATDKKQFSCDFCNRTFQRESTIEKHICEYKHRWQEQHVRGNQIGFQAWLQFYKNNTANVKKRNYMDFIKSSYYTAFAKFGIYCCEVHVINVNRYVDWLLKNKVRIDNWNLDSNYNKFLIEYLRQEDAFDALERSIKTLTELSESENILFSDYLKYGNTNKICYHITAGRISPWILYHSKGGLKFLESLDSVQQKIVIDYIDPERWAIKFKKNNQTVESIKQILAEGKF